MAFTFSGSPGQPFPAPLGARGGGILGHEQRRRELSCRPRSFTQGDLHPNCAARLPAAAARILCQLISAWAGRRARRRKPLIAGGAYAQAAMMARLVSGYHLTKMHDPPYRVAPPMNHPLLTLIQRRRHSRLARFS